MNKTHDIFSSKKNYSKQSHKFKKDKVHIFNAFFHLIRVMEAFECSQPHFLGHFLKVSLIYGDPHFHTIEIDLESHSLEKDLRSDRFHSQPDPQLGMKPGNNNEHLILFLDLIQKS